MKSPIVQSVLESESLPSLPTVAIEILELTNRSTAGLDDLAEVVMRDPGLTASILRLVNSSLFGMRRNVASIRQATSLLGMRSIKVLALSFSLTRFVKPDEEGHFNYPMFWRRSLTTAVACRLFADQVCPDLREEGFVAGLLSDIGLAALYMSRPDLFETLKAETARLGDEMKAEQDVLGISHAHLSEALLDKWKLPPEICAAVGAHHGERLDELMGEQRQLAALLLTASDLARIFCIDVSFEEIDETINASRTRLGIDADALDTLLDTLANHVQETAKTLSLNVGPATDYDSIRREAEGRLRYLADSSMTPTPTASTGYLCNDDDLSALLTGVTNLFEQARAGDRAVSVVLMGLDQCLAGQAVLDDAHMTRVRGAMIGWLSEFNRERGLCGQYNDNCFAFVLPSSPSVDLRRTCEEVQRQIPGIVMSALGRGVCTVTASVAGTTVYPAHDRVAPEVVLSRLASTLALAARSGGGRVEVCDLSIAA